MSFNDAFEAILSIHKRTITLIRPLEEGTTQEATLDVTPSNYFRNLSGPSEIVMEGREFVLSKRALELAGFTQLLRGDIFSDPELGQMTIREVREMFGFGGAILGYRVRVD